MVQRGQPEADRQEQLEPAGEQDVNDPLEGIVANVEAPEADVIEQAMPAAPQPGLAGMPSSSRIPPSHIPEADALEGTLPADREMFEDDE